VIAAPKRDATRPPFNLKVPPNLLEHNRCRAKHRVGGRSCSALPSLPPRSVLPGEMVCETPFPKGAPPMAMTATECSRVLRERCVRGKVVLTVVVGEDELAA
jgi:hypothetical protein